MKAVALFASVGTVLAVAGSTLAQGGSSFGAAVAYDGPQIVSGSYSSALSSTLVFSALDQQIRGGLSQTRSYPLMLAPGAGFRAETSQSAGRATMDTIMRARNSANTQFAFDDDAGVGAYSLFNATVPADGAVTIDVTRFGNASFSDATSTSAAEFFDLNVFQTVNNNNGVNVQWYRFTGLGGALEAEVLVSSGYTDTMLAAFDSAGNLLGSDDDDGAGLLSLISASDNILVPSDGVIYLAVTNFRNPLGSDANPASYINDPTSTTEGSLRLRVVPTPGAAALLGLGGLVGLRRRRA